MTETEFQDHVESIYTHIDEELYKLEVDFDYLVEEGVLTFDFDNGSKIIVSRQSAVSQLWLATQAGAFHFSFDEASKQWLENSSKEQFLEVLGKHTTIQSGEDVSFSAIT